MTLTRFLEAQEGTYATALAEVRAGHKRSHWMWWIFPQLRGLGRSETARRYGIADAAEARAYLGHPVLGPRLIEVTEAMLAHAGTPAAAILGQTDAQKLRSSATLFAAVGDLPCFDAVIDRFYDGARCRFTQGALENDEYGE